MAVNIPHAKAIEPLRIDTLKDFSISRHICECQLLKLSQYHIAPPEPTHGELANDKRMGTYAV